MLEPRESLSEGQPLSFGQCVKELGGYSGGKEVQAGGVGLGGLGGKVLGDKPLAKQSAKLIAIEHSPSVFCLLCAGKSVRVRIIGKDVAGELEYSLFAPQGAMMYLENLIFEYLAPEASAVRKARSKELAPSSGFGYST